MNETNTEAEADINITTDMPIPILILSLNEILSASNAFSNLQFNFDRPNRATNYSRNLRNWFTEDIDAPIVGQPESSNSSRRPSFFEEKNSPVNQEAKEIRDTVTALEDNGLTEEILRANLHKGPNNPFTVFDKDLLVYLVTRQNLAPQAAVQELNHLNLDMVRTLHGLYESGLRGHHLRSWEKPLSGEAFSLEHKAALEYLLKDAEPDYRKSPVDAIELISRKSSEQARDLLRILNPDPITRRAP